MSLNSGIDLRRLGSKRLLPRSDGLTWGNLPAMLRHVPNLPSRSLALEALRRLRHGRLEVVDGGRRFAFGPAGAELRTEVRVLDPSFWRSLARGTVGLAERWMDR